MCAGLAHNEQRCVPQSRLSYDQSSSSKAEPIKLVLVKLTNQVQQKDAPIKESEGPIVIDNLDQSDVENISKGADVNNHEARISTSAFENFQPTWCPSGLSRTQKRKLQRARCK